MSIVTDFTRYFTNEDSLNNTYRLVIDNVTWSMMKCAG